MSDLMGSIAPMLALSAANMTRNPHTRAANMQSFQMGQQNARYQDQVARAEAIRKDTVGLISEAYASGSDNPIDFAALAQKYPNGDPQIWASVMSRRYGTDASQAIKLLEMAQQMNIAGMKDKTTRRGQDITAQTASAGHDVTKRGQDITASTTIRGQDQNAFYKGKARIEELLDLKRKVQTREETPDANQAWMQFSASKNIPAGDREALVKAIDAELAQLGHTTATSPVGESQYQPGQTYRDKTTGKLWRVESIGVNGEPVWGEVAE